MTLTTFVAAVFGVLFGLAADRLSTRWPIHDPGTDGTRGIDWRTLTVAIGGALAFGLLAARWQDARDLAVLGIYVAALVVLLATDLDQRLLPDLITLPLIVYAAAVTLLGLNPVLVGKASVMLADGDVTAIAAAILVPAGLALSDRLFHGSLGMGDLKLSVSLGLMFGLSQFLLGFLIASVGFAAVVLVLVLTRRLTLRTAIPFGPALIAAGVLAAVMPT